MRSLVEPEHPQLSIRRQCQLLGLNRSNFYYQPVPESTDNLALMAQIDAIYTRWPFLGSRKIAHKLSTLEHPINRKRVQRLMRQMGIQAIYPKPNTSKPSLNHKIYPYLLRNVPITHIDQVWSIDITYIPLPRCFAYLVAIMDWYSRFVLSWRLSNTMDVGFCLDALEDALRIGTPQIFNSDQGSQFTSQAFTGRLLQAGIQISMDGRGRCLDNIWIERLWRSAKYEEVYLNDYQNLPQAHCGLGGWFPFYNFQRPHQALGYRTPADLYGRAGAIAGCGE